MTDKQYTKVTNIQIGLIHYILPKPSLHWFSHLREEYIFEERIVNYDTSLFIYYHVYFERNCQRHGNSIKQSSLPEKIYTFYMLKNVGLIKLLLYSVF